MNDNQKHGTFNQDDLTFQKALIDQLICSLSHPSPASYPKSPGSSLSHQKNFPSAEVLSPSNPKPLNFSTFSCPAPETIGSVPSLQGLKPLTASVHSSTSFSPDSLPSSTSISSLNVAAYIRTSTDFPDQQNSFAAQEQYFFKRITATPGWNYVGTYFDYATSGTGADDRVGFQRLLRHCREGKIDRILCKSISRFHRNTADFLEFIHLLQTKHISILFEEENLDTTKPVDEFILTTLAAIAQEESRSISENIKKNVQIRFSKGNVIFRQIYGYRIIEAINLDGQPIKKITIDPTEAEIVRLIYRRVLEGKKFTQIALELNRMLIPYPISHDVQRGRKGDFSSPDRGWTGGRIRQILTNERYTGDVICQKTYKRDVLSKYSEKNKGQIPQYLVTDHHPAIITREDFEAVQKLLSKRRPTLTRKIYPLSGRVVCGQCGRVYHLLPSHSIFPKWCCPQSADKKNSRLVCCEPWLYEIQIFRAIKEGFAHRFCLYTLLKNQKKDHAALDSFFSALFSVLQEPSQNGSFEDERSFLRHHVQIARQTNLRQKQHLDDVSALLRTTKQTLAMQSSHTDVALSTIMLEHAADCTSLHHLEKLYQKCQNTYQKSLDALIEIERIQTDMESYWKNFEKDHLCRKAAISWLLSLSHDTSGLKTFLKGLETVHFHAWIMKITVLSPDTFTLFWCDRTMTTVKLSSYLENEDDIQSFLSQQWPW